MSRKSNTEARRAEIVAAMIPVLAAHGYDGATVQLIARQAGLTPGLIHYHFASKRDILVELVKSLATTALTRFAGQDAESASPLVRLQAYLDARLAYGEGDNPAAVAAWVVIGAEAVRQVEVREIYQQVIAGELRLVQSMLEACLHETGRDDVDAEPLAAGLVALMEGAFQLASATGEVMPRGYAADVAKEMVRLFLIG